LHNALLEYKGVNILAQGSNDLNALLKAKVVKLRAELDVKGSLPKIRQQVDIISSRLESKPVKLKVVLDAKIGELNRQMSTINARLQQSKSFKPIKMKVDIDIKGSASVIKKQLEDVGKVIDDFNKKFSKQINMLNQLNQKLNQQKQKTQQSVNQTVPSGTPVGGIDTKRYLTQLKEVETEMRRVFGKKGNFSSFEFKDAEGNLRGFIGQLEKANGVVQKVRYNFNKDKGSFELVDQQTITQTQKSVEKAVNNLQKLKREIDNMGKGQSKNILLQEFKDLEKLGRKGMLDQGSVTALNDLIKREKDLAEVYKYQRKLIEDVARAKAKEKRSGVDNQYKDLQTRVQGTTTNLKDLQTLRAEYEKLNGSTKKYNDTQTQAQKMEVTRQNMLRQLDSTVSKAVKSTGLLSQAEAQKTRAMINGMQSQKSYIEVQQRMAQMNRQLAQQQAGTQQKKALNDLKKAVMEWGIATGKSVDTVNKYYDQLKRKAGTNISAIEQQTKRLTNAMTNGTLERTLRQQQESAVKHINGMTNDKFKQLVNNRDIDALKKYISELNKGSVATMKLVTDSKGLTRIVATMESAGKTARQFSYEISNVNKHLRQTGQADVFNANRNLGVMEQLRIAMARVPVWMASMTAFYGTLRGVQNMMRQIIEIDKLMVDINRVASDSLNMDALFEGAVGLSKELGNNLQDILKSLGEYARTFGDFNERQLLAITKTATMMSNVSDLSAQEATESLVGTMNAFNIEAEESIRIVDALNEVDNNYAISTKQLAEGLSKTASTAVTFGVTMEETVGHITAIGSVTMESGKQIGNGLKTIYSRITTMSGVESILNEVGVAIKEIGANGEEVVRPVNDILTDLAGVWHTLSDSQRQNIAVTTAGRYQLTRFLALMNNYETAMNATQTATTSHGSAMRENAKYMQSFEARINQLKNSFSEFALAVGDAFLSGAMMAGIEMLKDLAEFASNVADKVGVLPIVFLALFAVFGKTTFVTAMIRSIVSGLETMHIQFLTARGSATGFGASMSASLATARAGMGGFVGSVRTMGVAVQTQFRAMLTAVRTFSIGFKTVLASTGIGLLFVGVGIAIEKIVGHFAKAKEKAEELKKMNDQLVTSYREMGDTKGVNQMLDEYEALVEKQKTLKEGTEEYEEVTRQLDQMIADINNKFPTMTAYVDAQGVAHLKTTEQMREQVKATEELSKAQANVEVEAFNESIVEQAKNYQDLTKELEKLEKKQAKLAKNDGKEQSTYSGYGMGVQTYTIDNSDELAQNQLDQILKQAEITEAIQGTIGMIQKASIAYQEQNGTLQYLGDSQQKVIENFIGMNEEVLRGAETTEEFKSAQNELFELGNAVGDVFANAHKEMADSIKDMDLAPKEELEKLKEIETKFGDIAKSVPEDLFDLDKNGGIEGVTEKLQKVVDITTELGENASFELLQQELVNAGLDADQAGQYIANLAREQENSVLASQAQKEGYEGVGEGLEVMNQEMIEALDLTKELFGYSNSDLQAIESYLQYMDLVVAKQGEAGRETERYKEIQSELASTLGVSVEELEKNQHRYELIASELQQVDFSEYSDKQTWDEFINSLEGVSETTKEYLKTNEEGQNIITRQKETTEENTEATKEQTQANKDLALSEEEVKVKTDELNTKFQETKDNLDDENARASWLSTVRTQLGELGTGIQVVQDDAGNFKLQMADGSTSPYLESLKGQLSDLGYSVQIVKDDAGNMKLAFMDGEGNYQVIDNIGEGLEGLGIKVDGAIEKADLINEKEIKPTVDVDFLPLTEGLGEVETSLGDLQTAFDNLKDNISKLTDIESVLSGLKSLSEDLKDAIAGIFSNSKGDFEQLETHAKNASDAVEDLEDAIEDVKNLASRIDTGGINDLKDACKNAKDSVKKFGDELKKIPDKADSMKSGVKTASEKAEDAINDHKKAIEKLGDAYSDAKTDVNKAMESMKDKVVSTTSTMIGKHNSQADAIDDVAQSARDAKTAIGNMNSSIAGAMSSMDKYIAKANRAKSAGNSVPKAPSGGLFGLFGLGGSNETSSTGASEGVTSAMSTFSASAGEATGATSGGGGGTSGTLVPSIYSGGVDLDGMYQFRAFAEKEEKAELFKPNYNEREINVYNGLVSQLETKMQRIAKNTLTYRNALKDVVAYQNKVLTLSQKELKTTEARQSTINKRLKQLGDTSKHTVKQREEYNKLQQEYDSNISKIASLKQSVESMTNEIKAKSEEIFSDFIDEIVGKYDTAIDKLKAKTDDIDFKIDVLALTDPENMKEQLNLLAQKSNTQQEERNTLGNKKDSLQSEYDKAVKKHGSSSSQAKKVKEELDAVKEAWEDAQLAVLRTEKEIKDVRGKVADESIKQLKDYYKNMKEMAVSAIEAEKKALEEAHKQKMSQYDEQTKAINAVYDAQFKKMDKEKSQAEYQEQLDEKNTKKAELLNKISLLSRDNSLEGRKKLEELKKELADAEKDISDFMKQRQETLLKEELEAQKQAQLDAIEAKKETETLAHEEQIAKLDGEKTEVETHYDNILNDEKLWADKRNEFISGSFSNLTTELQSMSKTLAQMNQGNFNMLTDSFKNFSEEVKQQVAELNSLDVDNMIFALTPAMDDVKEVGSANTPKNVTTGTKVTTPKMTTEPAKPSTPAPTTKPKPATPAPAPANRYHTVKKGDTLWDIAKAFYGSGTEWKKIYEANANPDPRKLQIGRKLLIPFESGGYTGDWGGNEGKVAMLHKKELVLNKEQTRDILDTAKIMDKLKHMIPDLKRNDFAKKIGEVGMNVTNNYDLTVNIEKLNGDKEGANTVVKEIMKGLKKMGK
jgi:TP901 family phage tail tape measure protein